MKVNRRRTRKLLFQELYSMRFNTFNEENFHKSFYEDKFTFEIDKDYIKDITKIVLEKEDFFIEVIQMYAPKFNVKKMSPTYILPIYIALAEIFFLEEEIPIKVSLNEAIEIAKTYADDPGKKVVNGILNKVMENHEELKKKAV